MQEVNFEEALEDILRKDTRYHRHAYLFLREALEHTHERADKTEKDIARHVTGQELLDGIRNYALEQYGPMAMTIFEEWGVRRCEDWGEIVFNMIDHHLLAKTDKDSRDDFKSRYDFFEAFRAPYAPPSRSISPPVPEPNAQP